ncbi:MAG: caspase family protein [Candidatus Hydrogenedentota bacterium]|nr:MAG: caspase family protein [Candidatus Hydrogenedentota bacterium]
MKVVIRYFICFLILGGFFPIFSEKYAVIFGTNYQGDSPINDLNLCEKDATLMAEKIFKTGNFKKKNVKIFLADKVTRGNMKKALTEWLASRVTPKDQVFFYFSGHGTFVRDPNAKNGMRNFLVMFYRPHVSDDELSDWFSKIKTKKTVIIFDCCFSGGIAKKGARVRGNGNIPIPDDKDSTVLQDIGTPYFQNKVVIASSDDNETSIELSKPIDHGLFTYYFSKAITSADLNHDKIVTAYEAFFKARNQTIKMAARVHHKQHPQISGDASGFIFKGKPKKIKPPIDTTGGGETTDTGSEENTEPINTNNTETGVLVLDTTYREDVLKGSKPKITVSGKTYPMSIRWRKDPSWGNVAMITLSNVPTGVHTVRIQAKGYPDREFKTAVEKRGGVPERVVIARKGRGAILGHVWVGNFTQPFGGLKIFLSPIRIPHQPQVRSRKDGSFAFWELKPGRYRVFVVGGIGFFTKPYNAYVTVEPNKVTKMEIVLKETFKKK